MLCDGFVIHPRLIVKAFYRGDGTEAHEVFIPFVIFGKQDEMRIFPSGLPFFQKILGDIHLAAQDRLNPFLFAGGIKIHNAIHHAMVCQRQGLLPEFPGAPGQFCNARRAIQKAVFAMDM